jgi:hypothetical protein
MGQLPSKVVQQNLRTGEIVCNVAIRDNGSDILNFPQEHKFKIAPSFTDSTNCCEVHKYLDFNEIVLRFEVKDKKVHILFDATHPERKKQHENDKILIEYYPKVPGVSTSHLLQDQFERHHVAYTPMTVGTFKEECVQFGGFYYMRVKIGFQKQQEPVQQYIVDAEYKFDSIKYKNKFSDIMLISKEGKAFASHRVLLAAASSVLEKRLLEMSSLEFKACMDVKSIADDKTNKLEFKYSSNGVQTLQVYVAKHVILAKNMSELIECICIGTDLEIKNIVQTALFHLPKFLSIEKTDMAEPLLENMNKWLNQISDQKVRNEVEAKFAEYLKVNSDKVIQKLMKMDAFVTKPIIALDLFDNLCKIVDGKDKEKDDEKQSLLNI